MADFLEGKKNEIHARLKELRPLVDEYHLLEAAAAALEGVPGSPAAPASPRTAAPKPRRRPQTSGGKRRGRPKGSGTRGTEALAIVKTNPGITIPGIANKMGIKQNYLYRVLPGLAEDGLVKKDGTKWFPKEPAGA